VWIDVCAGWRQMPQESSAGIRQDSVWLEIPRLHGPVRKDVVISSQWGAAVQPTQTAVSTQPTQRIQDSANDQQQAGM
jgi:hypothetical protein